MDLKAWDRLFYRERELYPHRPMSINRPSCFFDMNNIAYNAISAFDLNVWRLADTVLCPVTKRPRLVSDASITWTAIAGIIAESGSPKRSRWPMRRALRCGTIT